MLGKRLKELRGKETQEKIATKLGISRARYSHYENEHVQPDNDLLQKIADLHGVSIDYLFGRTSDPKRVLKEQSRRLIDMIDLDLTDEEIMSKMDLYVDGQIVEQQEVRIFIDLVRGSRLRMKQGLASTESKQ